MRPTARSRRNAAIGDHAPKRLFLVLRDPVDQRRVARRQAQRHHRLRSGHRIAELADLGDQLVRPSESGVQLRRAPRKIGGKQMKCAEKIDGRVGIGEIPESGPGGSGFRGQMVDTRRRLEHPLFKHALCLK